jgi:tetratricopeptide (TPR) repeat protein
MWISFGKDFARPSLVSHSPIRQEVKHGPSTLRFAAKKKVREDQVVLSKNVPATKQPKAWTAEIADLVDEMRLHKNDFRKKAEALMLRRLEIEKEHLGDDSLEVALTLKDLGNAYKDQGFEDVDLELQAEDAEAEEEAQEHYEAAELHYGKALEHYTAALKISQKKVDPLANNLSIDILQSRASIYWDKGEMTRAEMDLTKALAMALDEAVEKAGESPADSIVMNLVDLLMDDQENPRTEEVALLKTNPQAWLGSRTSLRTLH